MQFFHSLYLSFSVFCGQLSTKFIIARSLAPSQANCHRFVTFLSYLSKFIVYNLTAYYHKKNFKTKLFVDKLCPLTYCYTNCRFARVFSLIVKRIEKIKKLGQMCRVFQVRLKLLAERYCLSLLDRAAFRKVPGKRLRPVRNGMAEYPDSHTKAQAHQQLPSL